MRAHSHGAAVALIVMCAAIVACAPTPSQLVVSIDSDLPVDREPPTAGDGVLRAVRVIVCEERCDVVGPRDERVWAIGGRAELGQRALPISFGVAPRDPSAPGSVEIVVDALRSSSGARPEDVLFSTSRRVTFAAGRVNVPIFLSAGCRGRACPDGTTCGDDGQCTSSIDAGADVIDGGTLDGGASDDAHHDGGIDAWTELDGGVPDASEPDAWIGDAGRDAFVIVTDAGTADSGSADASTCGASIPSGPTEPTFTTGSGVDVGAVTSVSFAPDGSELVAGRGVGPFDFDGAHSDVDAYFVSRRGARGSASWTTFFTYDPARRAPWSSIVRVLERDGVVYVAAQAAEAWTSGAVSVAELAGGSATSSSRVGAMLFGLDAATGAARWGHGLKTPGETEFVGGFTVDASGGWLVTRNFGTASGPTMFLVDRATRRFDRGTVNGRTHLVHVTPTGAVDIVHGIGARGFSDVDVVSLGSDVIVALAGSFTTADPVTGLGGALPTGRAAMARLTASGAFVWGTAANCAVGDWSPTSLKIASRGGRAFMAWTSTLPSGGGLCTSFTVTDPADTTTYGLPTDGVTWLGAIGVDACTGEHDLPRLWRARVNSGSPAAFTSLDADERGVAGTGYFASGGADLGLGILTRHDTGSGSDGFLVTFDHGLTLTHARLFGARASGTSWADDGGEHVAIGHGSLLLAVALSGSDDLDGVMLARGGRVARATLP